MNKLLITYMGLLVPELIMETKIGIKELKKMIVKEKQVRRNVSVYSAPIIRKAYKGIIIDNAKYYIFPRYFLLNILELCPDLKDSIEYQIDTTIDTIDTTKYELSPDKQLYPYQESAVEYLYERAQHQYGILYLQMDTGLGKSRVGCAFIAKIKGRSLIVVPTKAIAEQWWNEFTEMYPNLNINIYKNEIKPKTAVAKPRPKKEKPISDVDIIIINTFRDKNEEFIKQYSVMVLDEAHEYHSECNLKALWLSQTKYVLGLSATPLERPDGLDRYITLHLGDVIYPKDIPNFDISSVNFKANVKIIEYEGCEPYIDTILTPAGTISSIMTINNILNDPYRLSLIVNEITKLNNIHLTEEGISHGLIRPDLEYPKKHGIFVFVETRDFLIKLKNALLLNMSAENIFAPQLDGDVGEDIGDNVDDDAIGEDAREYTGEYTGEDAREYTGEDVGEDVGEDTNETPISVLRGGITKQAFNDARDAKAHIVLTTYGYSRRGISLPDMTALILVSPRRNGSRQIIGRILRRNSDEGIIRQIVDIVDVHTVLKSQSSERVKIYKEKFGKQNIKKKGIKWDELIPIIL